MTYLVAVYGEEDGHELFFSILKLLRISKVSHIGIDTQGRIHKLLNDAAHALIVETSDRNSLLCGGDILIFKKSFSKDYLTLPDGKFTNIIIPDGQSLIIHGIPNGQSVVACGANLKSSVTISSNTEGRLCMFIQRKLSNLLGEAIEPEELSLALRENTSEYNAMASALCCIMLGVDANKFSHIEI